MKPAWIVVLVAGLLLGAVELWYFERRSASSGAGQPARASSAPASARPWRVAWSWPAGAPLTGAPAPLGEGWVAASAAGRVAALDGKGRETWSATPAGFKPVGSPAVAEGTLLLTGENGQALALATPGGREFWRIASEAAFHHGPLTVRSGESWRGILLSADGALLALSLAEGRVIWRTEATGRTDGQAACDDRVVAYGNCDAAIHLYDAANGARLAGVPLGEDRQMAGGMLIRDGRVYGGTRSGELACVDIAARSVAWTAKVGEGEAFCTPVAAGDLVVAGAADGSVAALVAATGARRWRAAAGGTVTGLAILDDAVFVVAGGMLSGLRLADGAAFPVPRLTGLAHGPVASGRTVAVADEAGNLSALMPGP